MRSRALCIQIASLVWGFAATVAAQDSRDLAAPAALSGLQVTGTEPRGDCPSAAELLASIATLGVQIPPAIPFDVHFAKEPYGFSATIRNRSTGASRLLKAQGDRCAPLTQATALALGLLLDAAVDPSNKVSDVAALDATKDTARNAPRNASESATPPAPAAATPPVPAPETKPKPVQVEPRVRASELSKENTPARSSTRFVFGLGGGGLFGVVRPATQAFTLHLGMETTHYRAELLGLMILPKDLTLGPGSVHVSLWGGGLQTCRLLVGWSRARLDVCTGLYAAAQQATASGFTTNQSAVRPWLAIPLGVALGSPSGWLGWSLNAQALLPLIRNDFTIGGQASVYHAAAIGGLVTVHGVVGFTP